MYVINCYKNYKLRVWKIYMYINSFFIMDINNFKKNFFKFIKIVFLYNYFFIVLIEIIYSSFGIKKLSFVVYFQKMVFLFQDFNYLKYFFREKKLVDYKKKFILSGKKISIEIKLRNRI